MNQIIEKYIRKQVYETPIIVSRKISTEENIKFNKREDYYKLQQRADDFLNRENKKRFFVLPGLRGVGKTTLLLQIYEYLLNEKNVNPKNLLYVSCEEINFAGEVNIKEVIESYLKIFHNTTPALLDEDVFIFIDEVHYDRNWAMAGKIMFDKSPHIFMIFTGSSSLHLSYNADAARRLRTQSILPLNYSEHLKLKYNYFTDISKDLNDLIFKGEVESAQKKELKIQNDLISVKDYKLNDWDNYFKYGSFPSTLNEKYTSDIVRDLWSIIYRIVSNDISNIFNINRNTQNLIYRILTFLAEQKPGEISQNKVAASLNCSTSRINLTIRCFFFSMSVAFLFVAKLAKKNVTCKLNVTYLLLRLFHDIFSKDNLLKGCCLEMLEEKIRELYRITAELEEKYPGRRFTLDGHLVGSIGEVYAAEKYRLALLETSSEKHDALSADGRLIQIKITQTDRVSMYSEPD